MSATITYEPSVRGDVALLTEGRRGMDEDTLATAGAILLDAALARAIEVTGRRRLGIDRRRVVLGPEENGAGPLVAEVRRRVGLVDPDTPMGWLERIAVFGEDAVRDELVAAGLARHVEVPVWRRWLRHRTLSVDAAAADDARGRLVALAGGQTVPLGDLAVAIALRETELLGDTVGRRDARRIGKRIDAAEASLPTSVRAIAETLRERRRRADSVGTWYADD